LEEAQEINKDTQPQDDGTQAQGEAIADALEMCDDHPWEFATRFD